MDAMPQIVTEDGLGTPLPRLTLQDRHFDESWLQELLRTQPDLLPIRSLGPQFSPLVSVGREVETKAGYIDNLYVSPYGRLTIVETKLWRNPEARRDVVAQTLDYVTALKGWQYTAVDEVARAYSQRFEGREMSLADLVQAKAGPLEDGLEAFEEAVTNTLDTGRFQVLIVGDRIRESTIDIAQYLEKHAGLAVELALVELTPYRLDPGKPWPLLLVPRIAKRTEIVERSVVTVTIRQDGPPKVDVAQQKAAVGSPRRRSILDEAEFWTLFERAAPDQIANAKGLIGRFRNKPGISIDPQGASLTVKLDVRDTGVFASLFFLSKDGRLGVWPETMQNQITRAGFDGAFALQYGEEVRSLFKPPKSRQSFSCPLARVDLPKFEEAVESLINRLLLAEPLE